MWGLVCLQLDIWKFMVCLAPFGGGSYSLRGARPGVGTSLAPSPEIDPSTWQSQLNASVSAFQRRFVMDVRRCEELEKTFSELAPGLHPRQASWRSCRSSLV